MQYDQAARSEYARWVAAQRKPKSRVCAMCPNVFETTGRKLYCSHACRIRAYRKRRAALTPSPSATSGAAGGDEKGT